MQRLYSALAQRLVFLGIIGALVAGAVQPVSADIPLPTVDIVPISSFTTTENSATQDGGPKNPAPTNGDLQINGTATLPLVLKGLSASYDRVTLGALDSALAAVPIGGGNNLYPGGSRDLVQTYRLDYHSGAFNVEGGLKERYRTAPADSAEWHYGYVGLSYTTPSLVFLNHGVFVFGINAIDSQHNPTPAQVIANHGLSVRPGPLFATNQAITAVIPIDAKSGVRTATTFVWGAQDFFEGAPFPYYYDIFVFSGTKQVSENFGITANITQVHQRLQGAPFPSPGGVETSALNVQADFHVNFADFVHKPAAPAPAPTAPGRSTNPLVPGGPGGPAPLGPTQGGTVSPAPGAPPASPAPAMPDAASPAPMMSGAPASPSPAP